MADQVADIDGYIRSCPEPVRPVLQQIRAAIHRAVPDAQEKIAYQMPTITLDGQSLVHFAAWKHHIGLYPTPGGDDELARELAPYSTAKGTARFPLDQPMPYELIGRLTVRLVEQRRPQSPRSHSPKSRGPSSSAVQSQRSYQASSRSASADERPST